MTIFPTYYLITISYTHSGAFSIKHLKMSSIILMYIDTDLDNLYALALHFRIKVVRNQLHFE